MTNATILHVRGLTIAARIAGEAEKPALLLLHGWPQSRALYDGVFESLARDFFVVAVDLPEIGESRGSPATAEKSTLADIVLAAAENAGARDITVTGLDVGGMIAYAAARDHGSRISAAVVINTVIPGVEPWSKIIGDPRIWHFAFHAVPNLPEVLVSDREGVYFDFFHDFLAGHPDRISKELRAQFARAYSRPEALKAGFDWYRAMPADAKRNATRTHISPPLLYVRGDADGRPIEPYLEGLRAAGADKLQSRVIADSGELLPIEAPEAFTDVVRTFALATVRS